MRKLLSKPWFVAVIAVVALLLVGHSVHSAIKGPVHPAMVQSDIVAGAAVEGEAAAGDAEVERPQLAAGDALQALSIPRNPRDPFAARPRPEVMAEKPAEPDFEDRVRLSAIWTQNNATLVLINERIYQPGDEVGRVRIESATQEGVWITHWKGRDFLMLGVEFVLNTPASVTLAAVPPAQSPL
jgi:hypothetical protein